MQFLKKWVKIGFQFTEKDQQKQVPGFQRFG